MYQTYGSNSPPEKGYFWILGHDKSLTRLGNPAQCP